MLQEIIMSLWLSMTPQVVDSDGENIRFNKDVMEKQIFKTSLVDVDKNGKTNAGDGYCIFYDRNGDGKIDYSTSHLIRKVVPTGIFYITTPVLGFVDTDYNGSIDYVLSNYDAKGYPQKVVPYKSKGARS